MRRFLLGALLVTFGLTASAEDPIDKSKHSWAKFGVGSSVKMKNAAKVMGQETVSVGLTTLTAVTDTEYVLKMSGAGDEEGSESRLPLREQGSRKVGADSVSVGGTSIACTVWETVNDFGEAGKMTRKDWIADENGMCARSETKSTGPAESTSTSVLVKLDEKVKVGGREVACWVMETTIKSEQGEMKSKLWASPEVPGFMVKMESNQPNMSSASEVVEFTVK